MDNSSAIKAAHDQEKIGRTAYINDLTTASMFWRVVCADGTVLNEYDDCDCEDRAEYDAGGHLHTIAEWPGKPKPVSLGKVKVFDRDHNEIEQDDLVPRFAATEAFEAYELHAIAVTLDHQKLPDLMVKIEPGMEAIWAHRVRTQRIHGGVLNEDTMIFGRRLADGTEEITTVYPDGSVYQHDSLEEVAAHVNPATHVA